MTNSKRIQELVQRGADIPCPDSIEVGADLKLNRIATPGVCIHAGCRLYGKETFIAAAARIGTEGPVTLSNCYVGPEVELKSGFFKNAIFLDKASMGPDSHVREGTIVEEQAGTAHCVGLKQTILMPFVTLGSLINFCDCLMAGGTSRTDHSEVGSSFIHFNYTPNQDKATPSLLGDVPNGVMLNQRPIFMGGQGGLIGPCRIAYGTVSAAGTIVRKDQIKPDHLIFGGAGKGGSIPWKPGMTGASNRILKNNRFYIGNLFALREWYRHVRRVFISDRFPETLWVGLLGTLDLGIDERFKRLQDYIEKLGDPGQVEILGHLVKRFGDRNRDLGDLKSRDQFMNQLSKIISGQKNYIETIKLLPGELQTIGTQWLQSIVDEVIANDDFEQAAKK